MNILTAFSLITIWQQRPFLVGGLVLLLFASWLRYRLHEWEIEAEEEVKNENTPPELLTRRLRFYRRSANIMFVFGAVLLVAGVSGFFV